jgi:hypothetical protein
MTGVATARGVCQKTVPCTELERAAVFEDGGQMAAHIWKTGRGEHGHIAGGKNAWDVSERACISVTLGLEA